MRFAALVHDLGKGTTPREEWPSHQGHEERSVALIEALAARLRLPGEYRELAVIVARYHGIVHRAFELKPHDHARFHGARRRVPPPGALRAGAARLRGGLARAAGCEDKPYPQREYLLAARDAAAAVKPSAAERDAPGPKIAEQLHRRRLATITAVREQFGPSHGRPLKFTMSGNWSQRVTQILQLRMPGSGDSMPRIQAMALKRSPISPGSRSVRASFASRAKRVGSAAASRCISRVDR